MFHPILDLKVPFGVLFQKVFVYVYLSNSLCLTIIFLLSSFNCFRSSGLQTEGQQYCVSASISVQMLVEHVRMWGTAEITNEPFVELSSQLLDTIKRLAGHVISIIEVGGNFAFHNM